MPNPIETRPPIKSAWPTHIGKPLTDRKIAKYKKEGYYATGFVADVGTAKRRSAVKKAEKAIRLMI